MVSITKHRLFVLSQTTKMFGCDQALSIFLELWRRRFVRQMGRSFEAGAEKSGTPTSAICALGLVVRRSGSKKHSQSLAAGNWGQHALLWEKKLSPIVGRKFVCDLSLARVMGQFPVCTITVGAPGKSICHVYKNHSHRIKTEINTPDTSILARYESVARWTDRHEKIK